MPLFRQIFKYYIEAHLSVIKSGFIFLYFIIVNTLHLQFFKANVCKLMITFCQRNEAAELARPAASEGLLTQLTS